MIQVHRLEGFYRVAVAGGYTRAARSFPYPISQPGVHQQVRRLEEDLGTRLFERAGRDQVTLMAAGHTLFAFCAPFFEELPRISERLSSKTYGGTLKVDASALEIRHVLPAWLRRLRSTRPDILIDLEEITQVDLSRLTNGKADLIVEYVPSVPDGFSTKQVGTHFVFLVTPSRLHIRGTRKNDWKALGDEPFISFHSSMPHSKLQFDAIASVTTPRKVLSASSTEAILGFVAAGLGYSLVPWPSKKGPVLSGVDVHPIRGAQFDISAVWRTSAESNPLIEAAIAAST